MGLERSGVTKRESKVERRDRRVGVGWSKGLGQGRGLGGKVLSGG